MTITKVEIVKTANREQEGMEISERTEFAYSFPSRVDVTVDGTYASSWLSDDQELYEKEDVDSLWERVIVTPELRRAHIDIGGITIRTRHKAAEYLASELVKDILTLKAKEIIDTPDFPCGKDSDDIYMEGAGFVAELLHEVVSYVKALQEAGLRVDDLLDQLFDAHDVVKENLLEESA
tara:strand:+ start:79 stop:615 length:537 start_codon:yes stop_codon:yes gene_type:complete